jgi:integrase
MQEVRHLLRTAEALAAQAGELPARPSARRLHDAFVADQNLLLVRLAADSGARRGELAALRADDLDGRVLTIERAVSGGAVGPTKTSRTRRLTLGATTTRMIGDDLARWRDRAAAISEGGEWLLAPDPARSRFITCDRLSHRFETLRNAAELPGATLHRLRHMVATHLVDGGKVLKAQARLGHRDPATTLRHYSHAVQLEDDDVADELDRLLSVRDVVA